MKLFGTDGIRGKAGAYPLDQATVRIVGQAAAEVLSGYFGEGLVIMGRDTRESGPGIARNLADGFIAAGLEVWDLGVIPTPGVAVIAQHYPVCAGVVISASHNPYHDNGIKFFSPRGTKLPDELEAGIEARIHELAAAGTAVSPAPLGKKVEDRRDLAALYEDFLCNSLPQGTDFKGLRLTVDCANGATCAAAAAVLSRLGAEVSLVNAAPDGQNINRDCGALHPGNIAAAVVENRSAAGLAFDGDGDRIIFVDEKGAVRDGDYLLSIIAAHLRRSGRLVNNTLVTTVMANLGLFRAMDREGVQVLQAQVGDRYVYEGMLETGGVIGGEQSGHIIFREFLQTGDGILSALQVLLIMQRSGKTLSELSSIMQKYPQVLINTKVRKKIPIEQLPQTAGAIREAEGALKADGRVLVRYSGTENLLRVMIEGLEKERIDALAHGISDVAVREIEAYKN